MMAWTSIVWILGGLLLVGAPAGAESARIRGNWSSEVWLANQARLAHASDQELIAELAKADWPRRSELAEEISRRENVVVFVPYWRPFLTGRNHLDRCFAGLVLACAGDDEALFLVLDELAAAASELRELREPRTRERMPQPELWNRSQDAVMVGYTAVRMLGLIGDSRALDGLIEATRDRTTAYVAAISLGEIGDPAAIPALRRALNDHERTTSNEDVTVDEVVAKALRRLTGEADSGHPQHQ